MTIQQPEVCIGCGLNVGPNGQLRVTTGGAQWPYDCRESEGQPIYCGNDGILRTRPIPRHAVVRQAVGYPASRPLNGGQTPWLVATIQNPSRCLAALVVAHGWGVARYQVRPGNRWQISAQTRAADGDPIGATLGAGRGAPGGSFARALLTNGPVGRDQVVASNGPAGRNSAITSNGPVRRVSAGGGADQANNLVQSDTAVDTQAGVIWSDSPASIRTGAIWSGSPVSTEQVIAGPAVNDRELGLVNGTVPPRRFRLQPRQTLRYRMRILGTDGSGGDTFSDASIVLLLSLTTQPGPP